MLTKRQNSCNNIIALYRKSWNRGGQIPCSQYLNCRGTGGDASLPSRVSVPPSRLSVPHRDLGFPHQIWALDDQRKKTYKIRSNIVPNSARKVIKKENHFNRRRRPFFFGLHLILAKKHYDSRRRPFSFLVSIQFRRRNYVIFTKVWSRLQKRPHIQARSQNLEKGGLFWKSEKCANDLDPNFHCSWMSFTRFVWKLRRNFSESSEIQRFFPPKIRWSPKKKKKRSSPKLRLIFWPKSEIQRFFPPKIRWSPKKKSLRRNWGWFFGPNRKSKRLRRAVFQWGGGAIFNFSQKIGLKTTKMVRFCILHKPMGGLEPPPGLLSGYATAPIQNFTI